MQKNRDPSSFRDPSGYIFFERGEIFRTINQSYAKNYDLLMNCGLYDDLVKKGMLVSHKEVKSNDTYKTIQPELIKVISYPYEWSFEQLKDVALCLLEIQKISMNFGMTLKDATPFNFQFISNAPILIDTLSFETYTEGQLWKPYQQFCETILSPLLLAKHVDPKLLSTMSVFKEGIPLKITSKMLPFKTKFMLSTALNIHAHARSQKKYAKKDTKIGKKLSKNSIIGIIDNLESLVKGISISNEKTIWSEYYEETNYTDDSFQQKQSIIRKCLKKIKPSVVLDLGSNTGIFAEIAQEFTEHVIACDNDHGAINKLYNKCKKEKSSILPLVLDITNPSPNIGWMNNERSGFFKRVNTDVVFALAIIHHISISNNIPFEKIAEFFASITTNLIIEFVPKSDSQIQKMLLTREDIFNKYTQENFEKEMLEYFSIQEIFKIDDSKRIIYYFKRL
tara:strand:+ start:312 stop:1664 length:1353 start_codon:yes stop_codon:yes gene_type:complete